MIPRWVYTGGRFVPYAQAAVHVEDRGFQFADSIYEVVPVRAGRFINLEPHLARLERSLAAIELDAPMAAPALKTVMAEAVRRNRIRDGVVYLQVTRGTAPRDHAFPKKPVSATLIVIARGADLSALDESARTGVAVRLLPDERWARRDVKSTGLLANVLAKQAARQQGAYEAWLIDREGFVTEGSSTNAWIVDSKGQLRTRALSRDILPGVTRGKLMAICEQHGVPALEERFTAQDLLQAREAFLTAASAGVMPVTRVNEQPIGNGVPGPISTALREAYWRAATGRAGQ